MPDRDQVGRWEIAISVPEDYDLPNAELLEAIFQRALQDNAPLGCNPQIIEIETKA